MASPVFTLPVGVEIDTSSGTLSISYDGSITLEQSLGCPLGEVRAKGDLDIHLDEIGGDLQAGGTLTLHGNVSAARIHARNVILGGDAITCRTITADESIQIGAATLKVDAIVAPTIELDPKASGRVTVVESNNERGATKIKGGFSLADYDDMFGNAAEFLAERGIQPLDKSAPAPKAPPAPKKKAKPAPTPIEQSAPPPMEPDDEEDTDDPLSLSLDDLEPLMEQAVGDDNEQLHAQLTDALQRITNCYSGGDLPPAVEELSHLIEQSDYATLRANITEVWNGLLGFHQQRGIRPNPQVTHAFNVIHNLVQG